MLTAKEALENGGWRVVHGITNSIRVEVVPDREQAPHDALDDDITEQTRIRLEYEGAFDWLCPVSNAQSKTGALTKYFGKYRDQEGFKIRGIGVRQRSTPAFIESVQRELMEVPRHR